MARVHGSGLQGAEVVARAFTNADPNANNKDSNDSLFVPDVEGPLKRNRMVAVSVREKEIDDHIFKSINSLAAALQAQQDDEIADAFDSTH